VQDKLEDFKFSLVNFEDPQGRNGSLSCKAAGSPSESGTKSTGTPDTLKKEEKGV